MQISPTPWTSEAAESPFLRVLSAPDADGAREVVALVDGTHRADNAALIVAAPALADAIRAQQFAAATLIVAALDNGAAS